MGEDVVIAVAAWLFAKTPPYRWSERSPCKTPPLILPYSHREHPTKRAANKLRQRKTSHVEVRLVRRLRRQSSFRLHSRLGLRASCLSATGIDRTDSDSRLPT